MIKTYEILADMFVQEGVKDCFALLGDANMHWGGAMSERGVNMVYTRHEHAALAGAAAYARSSGNVGCATVTCGPGLTQLMTILPIAVRARIPLVLFAGEAPLKKPWYNQGIDQEPFVTACGASYVKLHQHADMLDQIRDAFLKAKQDRIPVVLGVPFDVQNEAWPLDPHLPAPSATLFDPKIMTPTDAGSLERAAKLLNEAKHPILMAGLGAVAADAKDAIVALADKSGALLTTTLPARGYFHDQDFYLGLAGGFASEKAREIFANCDLLIAFGARLASHAFDGGKLMPKATVVHCDIEPRDVSQGRKASDLQIAGDARLGALALLDLVKQDQKWRTAAMKSDTDFAASPTDEAGTPDGLLHPMAVVKAFSEHIPSDWHVINTSGHSAYYAAQMHRHPQGRFTVIREFGAIGNGTSWALGIATAFPDRPVLLIDGDGSALMHIQELETMQRHGMQIAIAVMNDGAYGSEVHKLRADKVIEAGSVFGYPEFDKIGQGFGLNGHKVTDLAKLPELIAEFKQSKRAVVWDFHISDKIASPQIHRAHKAAHS